MTSSSSRGSPPPDSLAFALLGAARACAAVRSGRSLPDALAAVAAAVHASMGAEPSGSGARGAIADIAYRTMRNRGRSDVWLAVLATRIPASPLLRELVVVALVLLEAAVGSPSTAPYMAFTVVDQAVRAAASLPELNNAKGFVNAILRRFLRGHEELRSRVLESDEACWNYPHWWLDRLRSAYPAAWQELATIGDERAPLTLRVNCRRTSVAAYLDRVRASGLAAAQVGISAVRLGVPIPVAAIPGFSDGLVSVQDEAAQRAAPLLRVENGMKVLDACAAPGGKACHLLEMANTDLTALDIDPDRLLRIQQNLDRLGLNARLVAGDARHPEAWWDGEPFDRIIADVPCTASGIVRRHPDIRWLRRESDVATLSRIAQQILDSLWRLLRPGGKLLLVTCSLFPEESELQSLAFGRRHADAIPRPAPGQILPATVPKTVAAIAECDVDHDGLFFALFEKKAG